MIGAPATAGDSEAVEAPVTGALAHPMLVAIIAPLLSSKVSCGVTSSPVRPKVLKRPGPTPRISKCLVPEPATPKPPMRRLLPVPTSARAERFTRWPGLPEERAPKVAALLGTEPVEFVTTQV